MSMNGPNGCSTCQPGQEKWEEFGSLITRKTEVQYEYRTPTPAGECAGGTTSRLEQERRKAERRGAWIRFLSSRSNGPSWSFTSC